MIGITINSDVVIASIHEIRRRGTLPTGWDSLRVHYRLSIVFIIVIIWVHEGADIDGSRVSERGVCDRVLDWVQRWRVTIKLSKPVHHHNPRVAHCELHPGKTTTSTTDIASPNHRYRCARTCDTIGLAACAMAATLQYTNTPQSTPPNWIALSLRITISLSVKGGVVRGASGVSPNSDRLQMMAQHVRITLAMFAN